MADRSLTILEITASGDTAGATRSIVELSLGLARRGHRVLLGARPESHIYDKLGGEGLETVSLRFRRKPSFADARRIAEVARTQNVDIVNAHASKDRYAAILARLLFGMSAKVVVTRRVMPSSSGGVIQGWFYVKGTDRIVAVSQAVKAALLQLGIPEHHLEVIPNGLSPERFAAGNPGRSAELMKRLRLPDDRPVLGVVSRWKDQADLLRALSLIDRPLSVIFVGIPPLPQLERLEQELTTSHAIRYVEFAWDVLPYYGLLDISILPSRIEGLSQTLLESMALGIPTIASRAGGNPDVVRHEDNGLLYTPLDHQDLAAQIQNLLSDPALRDRLRERGVHTARSEFSLNRTVETTEGLYLRLVEGETT